MICPRHNTPCHVLPLPLTFHQYKLTEMELETVSSGLRKLKFPPSAEQGIKFIHSQCEKFSHSGMPRLAQLSGALSLVQISPDTVL